MVKAWSQVACDISFEFLSSDCADFSVEILLNIKLRVNQKYLIIYWLCLQVLFKGIRKNTTGLIGTVLRLASALWLKMYGTYEVWLKSGRKHHSFIIFPKDTNLVIWWGKIERCFLLNLYSEFYHRISMQFFFVFQ